MTPEEIFRSLYLIRRVEEECCRVYSSDKIQSPFHSSIGQEFASVAVCAALRPEDKAFGSYRGHALYLAKGGNLRAFIAELYGRATGCAKGKGGSMHLVDAKAGLIGCSAIVGQLIPVAVGYAWAQKIKRTGIVTAVFFGDGATEEGVYFEALNLAALHKLPILFVCENNGYAIVTPVGKRQPTAIIGRANAIGVPAVSVETFDGILATSEAFVSWVRSGEGPRFLDVCLPRLKEHVGPDEDWNQGYRVEDRTWKDPVRTAAERIPHGIQVRISAEVEEEIADAFAFAEASPFPTPEELLRDVYGA